jgi:hypothetical protein
MASHTYSKLVQSTAGHIRWKGSLSSIPHTSVVGQVQEPVVALHQYSTVMC